jgi:transposase
MGVDSAFDVVAEDNWLALTTCLRDVIDALLYIATTGCQWRMLSNGLVTVTSLNDSVAQIN